MVIANKAHVFYSPHKIIFGTGTAAATGAEAKSLGASKVLIVTDPGVVKAGLLESITNSLEAAKLAYVVFDKVEAEPPVRLVDEGAARFRAEGCDLVLGVGGGSSLDVAKGVSIVAGNGGRILDYAGMDLVKKPGAPKILMPTTAGTGAEITRVLVVTDEAENTKKVVYSFYCLPELAIVDPAPDVFHAAFGDGGHRDGRPGARHRDLCLDPCDALLGHPGRKGHRVDRALSPRRLVARAPTRRPATSCRSRPPCPVWPSPAVGWGRSTVSPMCSARATTCLTVAPMPSCCRT